MLETSFYPLHLSNWTRELAETLSIYYLYTIGIVPASAVDFYEAVNDARRRLHY